MPDPARRFLKPADGLKVRNPDRGGHLKPEGDWVQDSSFWRRRLRDGDVIETTPPAPSKAAAEKKER